MFSSDSYDTIPRLDGQSFPSIADLCITSSGVTKLLQKLKVNKASGPDNISARILKELAEPLTPCLTAFFSLLIERGEVPSDWKTAFITPIYKKGNKQLAEN